MAGKHTVRTRRAERATWRRSVEVADARMLTAHLLTEKALAAARHPTGRYIALCGQDVVPVRLTDIEPSPCPACVSIPTQRTRTSR
jgi:hypothetical protein